jgi:hypothetical protein
MFCQARAPWLYLHVYNECLSTGITLISRWESPPGACLIPPPPICHLCLIIFKGNAFRLYLFTRILGEGRTQIRQSAKLFLKSSELGVPQPLTRRRVCPPTPRFWGEGLTRGRERGWESPNSDEGTYTVVLFIYSYLLFGSILAIL